MITAPRSGPGYWIPTLHRWYTVGWLCFGIAPSMIGLRNDEGAPRAVAMGLLVGLCLAYSAVRVLPGNRLLRPAGYLVLLAVILGVMGALPGGGAALLFISLPQFWIFGASQAVSVGLAGFAAAATLAGAIVASIIATEPFPVGIALFTVAAFAAAVLISVFVRRVIDDGDARADLLTAELARAEKRLAEAHRAQGAAEERERLAREIHDTVAQGLASIIVLAEAGLAEPDESARRLVSIERTARENFVEARALVSAGHALDRGSLSATLRRVLNRFAEDTGIRVEAELADVDCDQHTRIALLRCTQETLANVGKHAGAGAVGIVLARRNGTIELEITDDGRGFVPGEAHGFGLDGMRRRLDELGGGLAVTSAPGEGARVVATVPATTGVV